MNASRVPSGESDGASMAGRAANAPTGGACADAEALISAAVANSARGKERDAQLLVR